jgi:hypothetical protein
VHVAKYHKEMKKINALAALSLLLSYYSFGQVFPNNQVIINKPDIPRNQEAIIVEINQPLLFIGNLETKYGSLFIDEDNLRILETYTDSTQLVHFGEKGKDGVIVAELKNKVPLFRLGEVLDHFHVPTANRHLKVLVDKKFINAELFLADIKLFSRIELLEVTQQDILLSPVYNSHWVLGEKYLNIVIIDK